MTPDHQEPTKNKIPRWSYQEDMNPVDERYYEFLHERIVGCHQPKASIKTVNIVTFRTMWIDRNPVKAQQIDI